MPLRRRPQQMPNHGKQHTIPALPGDLDKHVRRLVTCLPVGLLHFAPLLVSGGAALGQPGRDLGRLRAASCR